LEFLKWLDKIASQLYVCTLVKEVVSSHAGLHGDLLALGQQILYFSSPWVFVTYLFRIKSIHNLTLYESDLAVIFMINSVISIVPKCTQYEESSLLKYRKRLHSTKDIRKTVCQCFF
jgi:hypothetical protein